MQLSLNKSFLELFSSFLDKMTRKTDLNYLFDFIFHEEFFLMNQVLLHFSPFRQALQKVPMKLSHKVSLLNLNFHL